MCGYNMPKQCFIAMACNSKSCTIILWSVISIKLNIGNKMIGLGILALNLEKIWHFSKLIELMFKGELHCLQNVFLRMELQMNLQLNYWRKDNWAHLLKCWHAVKPSY